MRRFITLTLLILIVQSYAQKKIECDKFIDILNNNRILVKKEKTIGVIDTTGNIIIDFKYRFSRAHGDKTFAYSDVLLLTSIYDTGQPVLLNLNSGKNIVENFDNVSQIFLMESFAIVETSKTILNKDRYYINSKGQILFKIPKKDKHDFQQVSYVSENKICMITNPPTKNKFVNPQDIKYIYVDTKGKNIFNKTYLKSGDFHENLAVNSIYKNGVLYYGFIDNKGNTVINHKFTKKPTDFSDGYSRVEGKNGKFGYINNVGELKIQPTYDKATGFYKGLALVKEKHETWKLINKNNEIIKDFSFKTFQNNLSHSDKKQISLIKQIVEEEIFSVYYGTKKRTINISEKIIFDNSDIKVSQFKYGLATFSKYNKEAKSYTYGVITKNKEIILINQSNQF